MKVSSPEIGLILVASSYETGNEALRELVDVMAISGPSRRLGVSRFSKDLQSMPAGQGGSTAMPNAALPDSSDENRGLLWM